MRVFPLDYMFLLRTRGIKKKVRSGKRTVRKSVAVSRDGTGTGYRPVRSGPARYRSGFQTGRSAGRPARVLTLKFCFFHVKIYKNSVGSQEYLPDDI